MKGQMMKSEAVRFLIAGGSAAAINWVARIVLSLAMPFEAALLLAYAIGMAAGFWLYRVFVFHGAGHGSLRNQILIFLGVNAVGALVVLAASSLIIAGFGTLLPAVPLSVAQAFGHGIGIGLGAVANYFGHRLLTFAGAARPGPVEAQSL